MVPFLLWNHSTCVSERFTNVEIEKSDLSDPVFLCKAERLMEVRDFLTLMMKNCFTFTFINKDMPSHGSCD